MNSQSYFTMIEGVIINISQMIACHSKNNLLQTLRGGDTRNEVRRSRTTIVICCMAQVELARKIIGYLNLHPGWRLTIDGSLSNVQVDEFIYRDYRSLCQNIVKTPSPRSWSLHSYNNKNKRDQQQHFLINRCQKEKAINQ